MKLKDNIKSSIPMIKSIFERKSCYQSCPNLQLIKMLSHIMGLVLTIKSQRKTKREMRRKSDID
jgi:hypothetical protein